MHAQALSMCLVSALWLLWAAVRFGPGIVGVIRAAFRSRSGYAFALLAMACAWYAFPSSADKGEPPPPPPPSVKAGVIRLYYHAADGRLVPFDSPVRRQP